VFFLCALFFEYVMLFLCVSALKPSIRICPFYLQHEHFLSSVPPNLLYHRYFQVFPCGPICPLFPPKAGRIGSPWWFHLLKHFSFLKQSQDYPALERLAFCSTFPFGCLGGVPFSLRITPHLIRHLTTNQIFGSVQFRESTRSFALAPGACRRASSFLCK